MRYILFIIAMLCVGCGGSNSANSTSGAKLVFSKAGDGERAILMASRAVAATASEIAWVDFNLGDIGATTTYLFMLRNTGSEPATNVVLTSDNPAVKVSPGIIAVLEPEGVAGLLPIIRVTVQHGAQASGIGTAPILPMGDMVFNITASSENGAFVSAELGGVVRVASYEVHSPGRNIVGFPVLMTELETGEVISANQWGGVWPTSATAGIINTGNTPLTLDVSFCANIDRTYEMAYDSTVILAPGETMLFDHERDYAPDRGLNGYNFYYQSVRIGTEGVIRADRVVDEYIFHSGWTAVESVAN
jgi:hypothetical protein